MSQLMDIKSAARRQKRFSELRRITAAEAIRAACTSSECFMPDMTDAPVAPMKQGRERATSRIPYSPSSEMETGTISCVSCIMADTI